MSVVAHSQPSSFQTTRWVLTNDSTAPITWDNIKDFDGITRTKIARIFFLIIPALVYDLVQMVLHACFGTRSIQPIAAAKPLVEGSKALIPDATKQEHTDLLLQQVQRITPLAVLVISYLPWERDLKSTPNEFPIEAIFSLNKQMEDCILAGQVKFVDWELWKRIQTIPHAEKRVYPEIQGLDFETAQGVSNEKFLEIVKKLPHLKRLWALALNERVDETLIAAIDILQGTLEELYAFEGENGQLPGDTVIQSLEKCPRLTALGFVGLCASVGPSNEAMIALARKGQLKRLQLNSRLLEPRVYTAFFQNCPLEDVTVMHNYPDRLLRTLIQSRGTQLLSLVYETSCSPDEDLRALATQCPNLQTLRISIFPHQCALLEELFPRWKSLRHFYFDADEFSADQIVRMVKSCPSLEKVHLGNLFDNTPDRWRAFKLLGQLGRPLVISYEVLQRREHQESRVQEQKKEFPHVKVIGGKPGSYEKTKLFKW